MEPSLPKVDLKGEGSTPADAVPAKLLTMISIDIIDAAINILLMVIPPRVNELDVFEGINNLAQHSIWERGWASLSTGMALAVKG
jgi:hypothetical protein